jgi:hypothetical protein
MEKRSIVTSAMETAGRKVVEKGAIKAIESLPKDKQKKLARSVLVVASLVFLVLTVVKNLRSKHNKYQAVTS